MAGKCRKERHLKCALKLVVDTLRAALAFAETNLTALLAPAAK